MILCRGLAVFNGIQNYLTTSLTRRVYARKPTLGKPTCASLRRVVKKTLPDFRKARTVNPLQARLFGVWTLMSAAVRIYAAYHLDLKPFAHLPRSSILSSCSD